LSREEVGIIAKKKAKKEDVPDQPYWRHILPSPDEFLLMQFLESFRAKQGWSHQRLRNVLAGLRNYKGFA
jgi:hypothetical protein